MWTDMEGVKAVYTKGTFHSLEDPRENVESISKSTFRLERSIGWRVIFFL
jgi:hypothetical protein